MNGVLCAAEFLMAPLGNSWQNLNWRTEKHIGSTEAQSAPRQEQGFCQGKYAKIKNANAKLAHNARKTDFGV